MSDSNADRLEQIKAEWLTGDAGEFRQLFDWLWNESKQRCPQLTLKETERYLSFTICGLPVVRIDPQRSGLKLGFASTAKLFGLRKVPFPRWDNSDMQGVLLADRDDRVLLAIEDAYARRCTNIPMYYEPSKPYRESTT